MTSVTPKLVFGDADRDRYTLRQVIELRLVVVLACRNCRHVSQFDAIGLVERFGAEGTLGTVRRKALWDLGEDFLTALAEDFEEHGKEAIAACRENTPAAYVKVVAALLPKQLEVSDLAKPVTRMTDAELTQIILDAQAEQTAH
jgi:hypothetical protein